MKLVNILYDINYKLIVKPEYKMYIFPAKYDKTGRKQISSIILLEKEHSISLMHQISNYIEYSHKWNKLTNTYKKDKKVNKTFISKGCYFSCISFKRNKCILYNLSRKTRARNYRIRNVNKYRDCIKSRINGFNISKNTKKVIRNIIFSKITKHGYKEQWKNVL